MDTGSLDSSARIFFSMNGVDYIDSRVVLRILTEFEVSSVQARTGWNVGESVLQSQEWDFIDLSVTSVALDMIFLRRRPHHLSMQQV